VPGMQRSLRDRLGRRARALGGRVESALS